MGITLRTLKRLLREQVKYEGGVRAFGRQRGIQPSHVSEALKHETEPIPQVCAALGYRKAQSTYEKVEP